MSCMMSQAYDCIIDVVGDNILRSPGAEEETDRVTSDWIVNYGSRPSSDAIVDLGAGNVFALSPETTTGEGPTIRQSVNISSGNYTLYIR